MARVLETLGELSRVAGLSLREHVQEILPLIIEALNDASNSKKAVAITTLGKVHCLALTWICQGLQSSATTSGSKY